MVHPTSILFVTLDSCRYDTYEAARTPNLDAVGEVQKANAPGSFTYASHCAMFMGFTPGDASRREPFVNPKWSKILRMKGGGSGGEVEPFVQLEGRNVIDGLKNIGYLAIGTGSMTWFNPKRLTTRNLVEDFERYFYPGDYFSLGRQLDFVQREIDAAGPDTPLFVFMNVGETHVPYWHEGADWSNAREDNPCKTFADDNDAAECRRRQTACLEFCDTRLAPLLEQFAQANTIVCADHGDAWGEDGLWSHGFYHPKVLEVPLVLRLQNRPDPTRGPRKRGLFGRRKR
jgi:hypothetical protein